MLNNSEDLHNHIKKHNITMIDIRIVNKNYEWITISFPAVSFNSNDSIIIIESIIGDKIMPLDFSNFFIDLFLAHKTIVFFSYTTTLNNYLLKQQLNDKKNIIYPCEFLFLSVNETKNFNLQDPYRDIVGEIVFAMIDMGLNVQSHYYSHIKGLNTIVISSKCDFIKYIYIVYMLKYVVTMIANTYNVSINDQFGIFKLSSIKDLIQDFSLIK